MQILTNADNIEDFEASAQIALKQILKDLLIEGHYDRIAKEVAQEPLYAKLKVTWGKLDSESKSEKWQEMLERMVQIAYASRPYCLRCGECCRQGGPSLHIEDLELFNQKILTTKQAYTLRRGEPVRYNIEGHLGVLQEELIKIKDAFQSRYCSFYREDDDSCLIYQHRPIQCRVQECWNPEALKRLWNQQKLNRSHLLHQDSELMELLQVHDQRCAPERVDNAFKQFSETADESVLDDVLNILSQDFVIRKFFVEKIGRDKEDLDFLLGRPMTEIVRSYGMKVEQDKEGTYCLTEAT